MNNSSIPWVEKYRPDTFENIILEPIKKEIFTNIFKHKLYFPNYSKILDLLLLQYSCISIFVFHS